MVLFQMKQGKSTVTQQLQEDPQRRQSRHVSQQLAADWSLKTFSREVNLKKQKNPRSFLSLDVVCYKEIMDGFRFHQAPYPSPLLRLFDM